MEFNLAPGSPLLFELGRVEVNQHLPTTLVGYKRGAFLIVETPLLQGRPVIQEGDICLTRYVGQGRLVGFTCFVLRHIDTPQPLTFLSFPEHVIERSLRRHERVAVAIPAVVAWLPPGSDSHRQAEGMVLDLSQSGCRLCVDAEGERGQAVRLRLVLQAARPGEALALDGHIMRVAPRRSHFDWGIEFDPLPAELEHALANFIELSRRVAV